MYYLWILSCQKRMMNITVLILNDGNWQVMEARGKLSNVRNSGVGFGRNESGQEEGILGGL